MYFQEPEVRVTITSTNERGKRIQVEVVRQALMAAVNEAVKTAENAGVQ
jgi:hypothetical protein